MKFKIELLSVFLFFGVQTKAVTCTVECDVRNASYVLDLITNPTYTQNQDFNASCRSSRFGVGSISVMSISCPAGRTLVCYSPSATLKGTGFGSGSSETEARQEARSNCESGLPRPETGCSVGDYLGYGLKQWNPFFYSWSCNK